MTLSQLIIGRLVSWRSKHANDVRRYAEQYFMLFIRLLKAEHGAVKVVSELSAQKVHLRHLIRFVASPIATFTPDVRVL